MEKSKIKNVFWLIACQFISSARARLASILAAHPNPKTSLYLVLVRSRFTHFQFSRINNREVKQSPLNDDTERKLPA